MNNLIPFFQSVVTYSTPLLFVSLGVLIMEVSGIVNMGAEGIMLVGCLIAVAATQGFHNVWLGALTAMAVSAVFSLIFAYLVLECRVNQIVLGVAYNLVGSGLTITLNRALFAGAMAPVSFPKILGFKLPVYLGVLCVALIWFVLHRTKLGVQLRSVGENPVVVESVGISVKKLRYGACIAGGLLIGFGGAFFSTGILNQFTEGMTDGRGFIALAAVTFGKYGPWGTLGGVIVFGIGETLSYRLQASGSVIPYEFALMLPYVLTILALCVFSRNTKDPSALGIPYVKSH